MSDLESLSTTLIDWLTDAALPLWWEKGADHDLGGFHEALNLNGQPVPADRRARVQARQVYVYATAGQLGWDGPWREALLHGLEFFHSKYRRNDGLYRTVAAPDGSIVDDAAWLYDQAFALFCMAQAARVLSDQRSSLVDRAHDLRQALHGWRIPDGGFREPEAKWIYQSNPHMHLLEASLAWAEVDDNPAWGALADEIAALALARFIDAKGALHEFFIDNWKPAPGLNGQIVEPGHQFEWAWLLERWARLRHRDDAHKAAEKLFRIGVDWGVRDHRGVVTQQLLDGGAVYDDIARLWPQTERIKAAVIFGDEWEAVRGIEGLNLFLDTPVRGLWRDKLRPDGTFIDEPAPASSFYHIVCAIMQLDSTVNRNN